MVGVWLYHVGFPLGYAAGGGASLNPRGGWLLILVIRNGMIHGIVNLRLLNDFDNLCNDPRVIGLVGSGVLAPTGAVHIDLFGIDDMLKLVEIFPAVIDICVCVERFVSLTVGVIRPDGIDPMCAYAPNLEVREVVKVIDSGAGG